MNWADLFKIFYEDFKKLRLTSKLSILVTIAVIWIIAASIIYPEAAISRVSYQANWIRAAFGTKELVPMSSATRNRLIELRRSLENDLAFEIDAQLSKQVTRDVSLKNSIYNPWTLAQISMALPNEAKKHQEEILLRLEHWRHPQGIGWIEFESDDELKVPVISWVLTSKATVLGDPDRKEVDLLINSQSRDGWWGVYIGTENSKFASTYATAVAVIALCEVSQGGKMPELNPGIHAAVRSASDWLRVKRKGAFWMDYPNLNGTVRPALTGIVLHSLHMAERCLGSGNSAELADFDREYLFNLRFEKVSPEYSEVAGFNIHDNHIDHVRIYFYPSQMLGVAAAYRSGYLRNRAEAIEWLEQAAKEMLRARNIAREQPWVAAEYLIALQTVLGEKRQ
jgi:hypothetical protein